MIAGMGIRLQLQLRTSSLTCAFVLLAAFSSFDYLFILSFYKHFCNGKYMFTGLLWSILKPFI